MKGKIIRFLPSSGTGIIMVHVNGENGKEYQQLQFNKQHYDSSISKHIYKDQEVEVSLKKVGVLYQVENISYDIGKHLYRKAIYSNEPSSNISTTSRYRRSEQGEGSRSGPSRRFSREGTIKDSRPRYKNQDRRRRPGRENFNINTTPNNPISDSPTSSNILSQGRQGRQGRQRDSSYSRDNYATSNQRRPPQQSNTGSTTAYNKTNSRFRRRSSSKYNPSSNNNQKTDKDLSPASVKSDNSSMKNENRSRIRQTNVRRQFNDRQYRNERRPTSRPQKNSVEPKNIASSYRQEHTENKNISQQQQQQQQQRRQQQQQQQYQDGRRRRPPRNNYKGKSRYNNQYSQRYGRDRNRSRRYQYRMLQQRLAIYLHYKRIKQRKQISVLRVQTLKRLSYRRKHLNIH